MGSNREDEELLTPAQLGEWLQLPVQTLYNWRHLGKGPAALRVGKHTRYRLGDVRRWLEAQAGASRCST